MTIKDKISYLGGIKDNPICKSKEVSIDYIKELESTIKYEFPNEFIDFHSEYGSFSFRKPVKFEYKENFYIGDERGFLTVDYFYSAEKNSDCSILKIIEQYSDQIPKGYIPICDGESGDFICVNLNKKKYGYIYYWWHEGNIGEDLFEIENTFGSFILKLQVVEEQLKSSKEEKKLKVNASPELLKMLKKSGYGPNT